MKTAITLSLLPSKPTMPFILGPDLDSGFSLAAELGFQGVEVFPPSLESLDSSPLASLVDQHGIGVSTIGTGGGAVTQGLTLTDADPSIRERARDYVKGVIQRAGDLGASAIIGSMQGRAGQRDKHEVLQLLGQSLAELAEFAGKWDRPLLFEPLNRYESDLINHVGNAAKIFDDFQIENARILADLFHMNIEETNVAQVITENIEQIGHVHFVDSNRWPAGRGHMDLPAIYSALNRGGFQGFLAVEAFPLPDQETAARQAADYFKQLSHAHMQETQT